MKWFEDVRSILILACSNSRMIFKYKIGPEMSRPHQYKIGCFAKKTSTKNQSNQSKRCQAVQTPHWRDRHSAPGTRAFRMPGTITWSRQVPTTAPPTPRAELIRSLKFGDFWRVVQLIRRPVTEQKNKQFEP